MLICAPLSTTIQDLAFSQRNNEVLYNIDLFPKRSVCEDCMLKIYASEAISVWKKMSRAMSIGFLIPKKNCLSCILFFKVYIFHKYIHVTPQSLKKELTKPVYINETIFRVLKMFAIVICNCIGQCCSRFLPASCIWIHCFFNFRYCHSCWMIMLLNFDIDIHVGWSCFSILMLSSMLDDLVFLSTVISME